jgi:SNF2 family DNA or RNA helicase
VAETVWRQEAAHWEHTRHLRIELLRGKTPEKVLKLHTSNVDVHIINYEAVPWLIKQVNKDFFTRGKAMPWNGLVLDEIDRVKDSSGMRYRYLEKILPGMHLRLGLTGTPASNGYYDLHGQYRMLDDGKRLHYDLGTFRDHWFTPQAYGYKLKAGAQQDMEQRISDITLSMRAEDYLSLPDYLEIDHWIDLDPASRRAYDELEEHLFAQVARHEVDPLDGDVELECHNQASLRMKCRQLANGILYTDDGGEALIHDAKLQVLDSILHEAAGQPVLLSYVFRADMRRIRERYQKHYRVSYIGPGVGTKETIETIDRWNRGEIHLLLTHPASAGHGLNLQFGGHQIVWFGLTDNLRYYAQLNARLRRQGQTAPFVAVRRILARGTVDEPLQDLLKRKHVTEQDLREAIETYARSKGRL